MARKEDPTKRTAILNAARLIFLRDGYGAAKMSDIASASGVAPGTLYLYFDSKEILANAIGEDFFARLSDAFAEAAKKLNQPSNVSVLVDWAARIGTEERELFVLCKNVLPTQDEKSAEGPRKAFRNQLAQVLTKLQSHDHARDYDPESLADVVMGILHSVIMSCVCPDSHSSENVKTSAVKVLEHSLFNDSAFVQAGPGQR